MFSNSVPRVSRIFVGATLGLLCLMFASDQACAENMNLVESCASSLKMNEVSSTHDEVFDYSLLLYVVKNSSNEEDFKSKFSGLTSYGFFDGTLDGARKQLQHYENTFNLHWNVSEAESYAMNYLSPTGAGAFSDCVAKIYAKPGLYLSIASNTDSSVVFGLHYFPPTSAKDPESKLQVLTDGELLQGTNLNLPTTGTLDESLTVKRKDRSDDLIVQVTVLSHDAPLSGQALTIPPHITRTYEEESFPVVSEPRVSKAHCSGYNRWEPSAGDDVSLSALKDNPAPPAAGPGDKKLVDYFLDMKKYHEVIGQYSPGPGGCGAIHMVVTSPDMTSKNKPTFVTSVTGHVLCVPGDQKDHPCDVTGSLEGVKVRRTITIHTPQNPTGPVTTGLLSIE